MHLPAEWSAEADQLLAEIREATLDDRLPEDVLDLLDDPETTSHELRNLSDEQLQAVLLFLRLGRLVWIGHLVQPDDVAPD